MEIYERKYPCTWHFFKLLTGWTAGLFKRISVKRNTRVFVKRIVLRGTRLHQKHSNALWASWGGAKRIEYALAQLSKRSVVGYYNTFLFSC